MVKHDVRKVKEKAHKKFREMFKNKEQNDK